MEMEGQVERNALQDTVSTQCILQDAKHLAA